MKKAKREDKNLIIDILAPSFDRNQSVNYIVGRGLKRAARIRALMAYCFEVCYQFGAVFLSDDSKACALILYPEKKKTTFKTILLDMQLVLFCIGLNNVKKTLAREAKVKAIQPEKKMYYLWFIGVHPSNQKLGIGSSLFKEIIEDSREKKRPIYLETSTLRNLPWYQKFDFNIYHELDLSYKLYFLSNE